MTAFIAGSLLVPVIVRRVPPAHLMGAGLVLAAIGFGMLTEVEGPSGLATIVIGSVVYSLGISPVVILATDLIVGSAPVERAGAAAAISETSSEFGGALGIAILGSIGTAVYRSVMADEVLTGVAPEAAEAARGTLGGALAEAQRLPNQVGAELLGTARDAFAQAFELVAAVCAAVAVITAILAVVVLRRVRPGTEPEAEPDLESVVQSKPASA
jgi:DHA2 family multidrug resistance protein-like MFS transporter